MAKESRETLFRRLTRLFRSGPVVKRKVRQIDTRQAGPDPEKSSAVLTFQKSYSPIYNTIVSNAFNLSERMARYQDFNEMELCIDGDSEIMVPGGFRKIRDLAQDCESNPTQTFIVYSYDHNTNSVIPALAKQARQTCVEEAWEVTFDNGKKIRGTGNHRLLKRDGMFCEIQDLQPGDAMMPFKREDLRANSPKYAGYRWIYTIAKDANRRGAKSGWTAEHRLLAEFMIGRQLEKDEVVHHINFNRSDNRPENLRVMKADDHRKLHHDNVEKLNRDKWAPENHEWIEQFKKNHSKFMFENNPARRSDITFGKILETAKSVDFSIIKTIRALDISRTALETILQENGYASGLTFVNAYAKRTLVSGTTGEKHFKFRKDVSIDSINSVYTHGMSLRELAKKLGTGHRVIKHRIISSGYESIADFKQRYQNCKVVSVVRTGEIVPMYDLTVDGYKNFATDSVISHNTPEISKALDLYADETVAQDDKGRTLHVFSDNPKIKKLLEELFYDTLNVEFNLRPWIRNLPVKHDTPIPLLSGEVSTIRELSERWKAGEELWVYSVQSETNKIVPGKIKWCGLTRQNERILRVTLDDNTYVECSPDHEWVMRDGSRCSAEKLIAGDSLMPFYRKTSNKADGDFLDGYERVYDPSSETFQYTHRLVNEDTTAPLTRDIIPPRKRYVIHHIDFNKHNNSPTNLRKMSWSDHTKLHADHVAQILHTPEVLAKAKVGRDTWLRSDRHRVLAAKQLKTLQAEGKMRDGWDEYNQSAKHAEDNVIRAVAAKKMWSERNGKLRDGLRLKFDEKCVDLALRHLVSSGKYTGIDKLNKILLADIEFMSYFRSINHDSERDLTTPFKSVSGFQTLVNRALSKNYLEIVAEKLPEIAKTPWYKRAFDKSTSLKGITPTFREKRWPKKNHEVISVTEVDRADVYCMEVLGATGEHDRHNFMVLGRNVLDEEVCLSSGISSQNCKYGDLFLYNDVHPTYGLINVIPIPVNELEREEGFDNEDPLAVRFRWTTMNNNLLDNWEVTHIRLMSNDMFLPYGTSMIESARKIWRQLILIEDAMLVYRVVRAPERRVFYIDVGNTPPDEVPNYIEAARRTLRTSQVIDKTSSRVDVRYNPLSVDEDYIIPVRGTEGGTKIDTLAGGQNTAAVEDVQYIQRKLFAALGIPKAYLGYDDMLSSKATLAQEDIRFSRTINMIQRTILSELNKMAVIHLTAHGFEGEELLNFQLHLSNPSTVAQQQKLELWRTKFEICGAGAQVEHLVDFDFLRKNVMGLTDEQIDEIKRGQVRDTQFVAGLDPEAVASGGGGGGGGGGSAGGVPGAPGEEGGDDTEDGLGTEPPTGGEEKEESPKEKPELELIRSGDDFSGEGKPLKLSIKDPDAPLKAKQTVLGHALTKQRRKLHHGHGIENRPDFLRMTSMKGHRDNDPFDTSWLKANARDPLGEIIRKDIVPKLMTLSPSMGLGDRRMLKKMREKLNFTQKDQILTEAHEILIEEDIDISIDGENDSYEKESGNK